MHRLTNENTYGLIVDIQEKLLPAMSNHEQIEQNSKKLVEGLKLFDVPVMYTQQYTKGLGNTVESLGADAFIEKTTFSCFSEESCAREMDARRPFVIIAGIEAHVCVQLTALELLADNYFPIIVADCVSSRKEYDKQIALDHMRHTGVLITTLESVLFAICKNAKNENFRDLSKLIR